MRHRDTSQQGLSARTGSPTLQDVARIAGVSTATVSRCLNTPDRVVEETRRKVLQVVRDIGYSPNFSARALARSTAVFSVINSPLSRVSTAVGSGSDLPVQRRRCSEPFSRA